MAKTPCVWTTAQLFPTPRQAQLLEELVQSSDYTYNWVMDQLVSRHYIFNEDKLIEYAAYRIKPDWIDHRPETLCPLTMMSWLIREACHNWIDGGKSKAQAVRDRARHRGRFYMPASGHKVSDTVSISNIGHIKIEPVKLPGRLYVIEGYKKGSKWFVDLRSAPN